jgi:predicted TIM-barrel fold metal-dependent hydrolase
MEFAFTPYDPDMSFTELPYDVFDCDFHFYETADSFTRHLPKEHAGLVRLANVDGRTKMVIKGQISDYIPNPTFEVVAAPGSGWEYFSGRNFEGKSFRDIVTTMRTIPAFTEPEARLELMDRMHIQTTVNYPTLASTIEVNFMDDPEASQVLIHAFNRWILDQWGFDHAGRIYTTPVINLATAEGAVRELEWALENGARTVLVRPAPVAGFRGPRSPFLPFADPFWKRVEEVGIPVMLHGSDSGYTAYANDWNGSDGEFRPFEQNAFLDLSSTDRPIQDTLFAAVAHGMLSRFPGVRLASIENGARWVPHMVEKFEITYGKMPQLFMEHPLEVLKRAVYIAPFWEDPLEPMLEAVGADHILFNSDWPHPEGVADPNEYGLQLRQHPRITEQDVADIMGGNMYRLMGLAS